MIGEEPLHLFVVCQVVQSVPPLGGLQVASRLVSVQVTMAHGVVLEGTVGEGAYDTESLLRSFHCLQLVLLDAFLSLKLGSHLAHLNTEVSPL